MGLYIHSINGIISVLITGITRAVTVGSLGFHSPNLHPNISDLGPTASGHGRFQSLGGTRKKDAASLGKIYKKQEITQKWRVLRYIRDFVNQGK